MASDELPSTPASPAPSTRPLRPTAADRLVALVEVVVATGLPSQLAIGTALVLVGVSPWQQGALSMRYLVSVLLLDTLVVTAALWGMLRLHGESPKRVLFGHRLTWAECRLGAWLIPPVVLGSAAALVALRTLWPALHNVDQNPFEALLHTPTDALIVGAAAVLGGGVKEELQRAFILHRVEGYLGGAVPGLLAYSVVFGLGHTIQGWDVGIITGLLGLAWGCLFLWRRSATAPMVSHAGFNAAQILQYFVLGA